MNCIICTLVYINQYNDIDEYVYRVPYEMLLIKFIDILDIIIKSIFTENKYNIYLVKNNNLDITKLNKLISFQKDITIFQKLFNNKYDKIDNFKLLIKDNI